MNNKANKTSFKAGNNANPTGRPKVAIEFQAKARALVDELVLAAWENEVRTMGDNWLKASELLAAYGYGKPPQSLELSAKPGDESYAVVMARLRALSPEKRDGLEEQLAAEAKTE